MIHRGRGYVNRHLEPVAQAQRLFDVDAAAAVLKRVEACTQLTADGNAVRHVEADTAGNRERAVNEAIAAAGFVVANEQTCGHAEARWVDVSNSLTTVPGLNS